MDFVETSYDRLPAPLRNLLRDLNGPRTSPRGNKDWIQVWKSRRNEEYRVVYRGFQCRAIPLDDGHYSFPLITAGRPSEEFWQLYLVRFLPYRSQLYQPFGLQLS